MRRRLNFTQRIRINHSDIDIELIQDDAQPMRFVAARTLDSYGLPADAQVYLEAYRRNSYMRFAWGTVSQPRQPGSGSVLTDISSNATVYFRVKVIGEQGIILAQADRIRADVSNQSILPVEATDLDQIVWRLSFDDDEPYLLVNSRIEGILDRIRYDSDFAALVYPTMLREILQKLCREITDGDNEQQAWISNWQEFTETLSQDSIPSSDSQQQAQWIDSTVNIFAAKHRLLNRYRDSLNASG